MRSKVTRKVSRVKAHCHPDKPHFGYGLCATCYYHRNKRTILANLRRRKLWNLYGLTVEAFNELVRKQEGKCRICERVPQGRNDQDKLVVDHCHKTGRVRGLLCTQCNGAIGWLKDDPEILKRAYEYLREL